MRVLMLGWEFPPHISGGLGTACEGLALGLARHNIEVIFVVPRLLGGESPDGFALVDALGNLSDDAELPPPRRRKRKATSSFLSFHGQKFADETTRRRMRVESVPAFLSPYLTEESFREFIDEYREHARTRSGAEPGREAESVGADAAPQEERPFTQYGRNIFEEVSRYASRIVSLFEHENFDVIHAHDWMTYPAGVALSELTGKPLVVHVHSLEYDRSGDNPNPKIVSVENLGLRAASAVIAVSYYTRRIIIEEHGIAPERISVVHNGVYSEIAVETYRRETHWPSKVVLFLGRITLQKGPDYFVEAAARVIPYVPDVLFVMAGTGDMRQRMIDRVTELGFEKHFHFPGFLRGQEVEEMFSLADLYVMPSVSEPFGISALEAIKFDTPVIISRQSGVSEVLHHALKVDFWDIDRLAELIINALSYPELRDDMVSMAREEVKRLHWDSSAMKTVDVYRGVL